MQFPLFALIIMVMLNCHIGLPQHQPPLSKAQTTAFKNSLLKIGGVDARSLVEIKRRHAQKRTSVSIFGLQVCKQTCYCMEPPPSVAVLIRRGFSVAARMLLVISVAMFRGDAKLAAKSVQGCTLLAMRQRRCTSPALLQIDGTDTRHEHKLTAGVSLIR